MSRVLALDGPEWRRCLNVANIGTAVVLFPVLKRQRESVALGFVAARVIESAFIAVGILSVLAVVTLRQDLAGAGTDPATLETVGRSFVAVKDWTFLLSPGFVVGIGNGLLLGDVMYRSGLVPRRMAMLGLVGVLFGAIDQGSVWQGIATIAEFAWELSLGFSLIVRASSRHRSSTTTGATPAWTAR